MSQSTGSKFMKIMVIAGTILLAMATLAFAGDLNRLLSVKGMTCPACSEKVEHALTTVPGVKSAAVDLKSGQAKVVVDERVKPGHLVAPFHNTGFNSATLNPH